MVKTIYSDVIFNFGKYKGKEVAQIMRDDPGYLYWCDQSGVAKLAPDISEYVGKWVKANPGLAAKAEKSAKVARSSRKAEMEEKGKGNAYTSVISSATPSEFQPSGKSLNENWGAW